MLYNSNKIRTAGLAVAIAAVTLLSACTKKNDSAGVSQFIGKWRGNSCAHAGTLTISAGTNNYSVYVAKWISANDGGPVDTCGTEVKILGTLSGNTNQNNFTMAQQTFSDKCGNNFTMSGGATLIGDTLYISFVSSSTLGTSVCTFKGYK